MIKSHAICLNPTPEQEQYFWQAAGIAGYAYNWGWAEYNKRLDHNREVEKTGQGEKMKCSGRLLKKEFNKIRPEWVGEVTCWAYQGAFDDLQAAFRNYFDKNKKGLLKSPRGWKGRKDKRPFGWPTPKKKFKSTPSFYLANSSLNFDKHRFWFDKKRVGWINMTEQIRFPDGRILGGRISYRHGYWWLSVQFELPCEIPRHNGDAVGVDLGVKYLAATSDGELYDNPKAFAVAQRKLRVLLRKLDRQRRANNPDNYNADGTVKSGRKAWGRSKKMIKTEAQIQKLYYRMCCVRQDASHKLTTELVRDYGIVCIEDLNIKGMLQNGRLSKAISDAALYEKRRQLEYKARYAGGVVAVVDRWFPSSKLCSNCGYKNTELTLSQRQWTCPECEAVNHRDGNAALNIKKEGLRVLQLTTEESSPEYPPGDEKNGPTLTQSEGYTLSVNQEPF